MNAAILIASRELRDRGRLFLIAACMAVVPFVAAFAVRENRPLAIATVAMASWRFSLTANAARNGTTAMHAAMRKRRPRSRSSRDAITIAAFMTFLPDVRRRRR